MGVTINKKSTTTEPSPWNGQQPKPPGGLKGFYWHQIFALDSAVVEVQEMFSSHGGHLINAMCHHGETCKTVLPLETSSANQLRIYQICKKKNVKCIPWTKTNREY